MQRCGGLLHAGRRRPPGPRGPHHEQHGQAPSGRKGLSAVATMSWVHGPRAAPSPGPGPEQDALAALDRGSSAEALTVLMRVYGSRPVYRYCRQMVADDDLAQEVHQMTFIQAYEGLARFGRRSSLRTWLFGIARHRCLDLLKSNRRRRSRSREPAGRGAGPSPDRAPTSRTCWRSARAAGCWRTACARWRRARGTLSCCASSKGCRTRRSPASPTRRRRLSRSGSPAPSLSCAAVWKRKGWRREPVRPFLDGGAAPPRAGAPSRRAFRDLPGLSGRPGLPRRAVRGARRPRRRGLRRPWDGRAASGSGSTSTGSAEGRDGPGGAGGWCR